MATALVLRIETEMQTATYVALSNQSALGRTMDVLANNLANMSTTGFKGEQSVFQTYLTQGPKDQKVAYVRDVYTIRDMRQGDLVTTGNALDTGIDGNGFYTVNTADGARYTRNGRFQLNPQGQLVTAKGDPVLDDQGAPITVPTDNGKITISDTGTISTDNGPVAKLGVVAFADPQQLQPESNGLFSSAAPPAPDAVSHVRQGMIEASNIQPVVEMTRLIKLQRAYSSVQDILDTEDTRQKNAIDKLSRVA